LTIVNAESAREGHLTDLLGPRFTVLQFVSAVEDARQSLDVAGGDGLQRVPLRIVPIAPGAVRGTATVDAWDHSGRVFAMYDAAPVCIAKAPSDVRRPVPLRRFSRREPASLRSAQGWRSRSHP
jgi:hypothetical protein